MASLVRAQPVPFLINIIKWLLVAIPATACNSLLSYIQNKLAIAYRTRLTEEVMRQYLGDENDKEKIFYKMCEYLRCPSYVMTCLTEVQLKCSKFGRSDTKCGSVRPQPCMFVYKTKLITNKDDHSGHSTIFYTPCRNLCEHSETHPRCRFVQLSTITKRRGRRTGPSRRPRAGICGSLCVYVSPSTFASLA